MANDEHVALLKKGVDAWNKWRVENFTICPEPDLSGADLSQADLKGANLITVDLSVANLRGANLSGANLSEAKLSEAKLIRASLVDANLSGANLFGANLSEADLTLANLNGANLNGADLTGADLNAADLIGANLGGADLRAALLIDTDFSGADLTGCRIHGISAWGLKLEGTEQQNLVITKEDEPKITVDNIEVAQFIYLMLHNQKIRDVIDTITSKAVLILGRFTEERKPVLEALREELRQRKYLPILFDFEKPSSRNTDETITLLARMARFVVADISDAKSVLQELRAIVPDLPSVPVQPIILAMQEEPGMFDFYRNFRSFLNVHRYANQEQLIADLGEKVIRPAELKVLDLQGST
jgi:Pentapeptide repeats (8 copies)